MKRVVLYFLVIATSCNKYHVEDYIGHAGISMTTGAVSDIGFLIGGSGPFSIHWGDGTVQKGKFAQNSVLLVGHIYANNTTSCAITINGDITSLNVSGLTALTGLQCDGNELQYLALNALFETLHSNAGKKYISISGNPGSSNCNRSIATNKGWIFY